MGPKSRYTSRKFLLAVGAVLTALGAAFAGEVDWDSTLKVILAAVVAYSTAEGAKDVVEAYRGGAKPVLPLPAQPIFDVVSVGPDGYKASDGSVTASPKIVGWK